MQASGTKLRDLLDVGRAQARQRGSTTLEAEHLLLALVVGSGPVRATTGLDADAVGRALDREFELSLAAAGVVLADLPRPPATPHPGRDVAIGTSAKVALVRASQAAGGPGHRVTALHVLVGLLDAEVGTVPRALALARVDRVAARDHAVRALRGGA